MLFFDPVGGGGRVWWCQSGDWRSRGGVSRSATIGRLAVHGVVYRGALAHYLEIVFNHSSTATRGAGQVGQV